MGKHRKAIRATVRNNLRLLENELKEFEREANEFDRRMLKSWDNYKKLNILIIEIEAKNKKSNAWISIILPWGLVLISFVVLIHQFSL